MPFLTGMEDYPSHINVIPTLKKLDEKLPLYYREMLDYFKELRVGHPDLHKSEFILWNNKEITIENKSIFWTHLSEQGICFVLYMIYLITTAGFCLLRIYNANIMCT